MYISWLKQLQFPQDDALGCLGFARDQLLEESLHLAEQQKQLREKLEEISKLDRYCEEVEAICKVKGVGRLTAIRMLLEIGEFGAFHNSREFTSYLGLTPSECSSGERKTGPEPHPGPILPFNHRPRCSGRTPALPYLPSRRGR